jgi:hypothetical protein
LQIGAVAVFGGLYEFVSACFELVEEMQLPY